MNKIKLVLRRIVQLIISSFAMMFIMERLFMDLPFANFVGVYTFGAMLIWCLLLIYETPIEVTKKRPVGNYYKEVK